MTDAAERAIAAITLTLGQADDADHTWTARAILATLRGLGWRPTQATAPPDWQRRGVTPAEPTAEYLAARPPTRERT